MAIDKLFISPAKAKEIDYWLDWLRRFNGKAGLPDGYRGSRPSGTHTPIPKLGKAHDNIAPRTFGAVDIWSGKPGSETKLDLLTSPVQEFNLLDRTITAGYWCWMFGQYIFGAHFPARDVWGTLSGALAPGGSASFAVSDFANGDDPGSTITVYADPTQGATTIADGKAGRALWHDRKQQYILVSWAC